MNNIANATIFISYASFCLSSWYLHKMKQGLVEIPKFM